MSRKVRQLTVRGLDEELAKRLKTLARRERVSLNKAALLLLRRGAGLGKESNRRIEVVGDSLDHLIGAWSEKEEKEFLKTIEALEQVDEDLWA